MNDTRSPIEHENTDPAYWEKILESEGLGVVEETKDTQRQQVWEIVEGAIKRDRHSLYAVPRSQEELMHDIHSAVDYLSVKIDPDITWKIHTSCSFGCDCIILSVKGKRSLHINTHLVANYDRGEIVSYLIQIGTEDEGLYE